jgi:U3 small nucleolar RNA-associated protein 20
MRQQVLTPLILQGISQSLHSSSPVLFAALIELYIDESSLERSDALFTLIRRTVTALLHHVSGPQPFQGIAAVLVQRLEKALEAGSDDNVVEKLSKILCVCWTVRKGSRMTGGF